MSSNGSHESKHSGPKEVIEIAGPRRTGLPACPDFLLHRAICFLTLHLPFLEGVEVKFQFPLPSPPLCSSTTWPCILCSVTC